MINLIWAIGASIIVSLVSLVGIFTLALNDRILKNMLFLLIGFAAGGLIGGAFLHILPEAVEYSRGSLRPFIYVIAGFMVFFILEKYLYWRHCHEGRCDVHIFSYLNLIGDGIHNFIDGLIIGTSFLVNINFGIITTVVIIFHEIPQEIGDFGVLVYGGLSKIKALFYNFISALTAVLGTIIGYYFANNVSGFSSLLLPITAGGFIYIASCDLIPELHKQSDLKRATFSMLAFILGVLLLYFLKMMTGH